MRKGGDIAEKNPPIAPAHFPASEFQKPANDKAESAQLVQNIRKYVHAADLSEGAPPLGVWLMHRIVYGFLHYQHSEKETLYPTSIGAKGGVMGHTEPPNALADAATVDVLRSIQAAVPELRFEGVLAQLAHDLEHIEYRSAASHAHYVLRAVLTITLSASKEASTYYAGYLKLFRGLAEEAIKKFPPQTRRTPIAALEFLPSQEADTKYFADSILRYFRSEGHNIATHQALHENLLSVSVMRTCRMQQDTYTQRGGALGKEIVTYILPALLAKIKELHAGDQEALRNWTTYLSAIGREAQKLFKIVTTASTLPIPNLNDVSAQQALVMSMMAERDKKNAYDIAELVLDTLNRERAYRALKRIQHELQVVQNPIRSPFIQHDHTTNHLIADTSTDKWKGLVGGHAHLLGVPHLNAERGLAKQQYEFFKAWQTSAKTGDIPMRTELPRDVLRLTLPNAVTIKVRNPRSADRIPRFDYSTKGANLLQTGLASASAEQIREIGPAHQINLAEHDVLLAMATRQAILRIYNEFFEGLGDITVNRTIFPLMDSTGSVSDIIVHVVEDPAQGMRIVNGAEQYAPISLSPEQGLLPAQKELYRRCMLLKESGGQPTDAYIDTELAPWRTGLLMTTREPNGEILYRRVGSRLLRFDAQPESHTLNDIQNAQQRLKLIARYHVMDTTRQPVLAVYSAHFLDRRNAERNAGFATSYWLGFPFPSSEGKPTRYLTHVSTAHNHGSFILD